MLINELLNKCLKKKQGIYVCSSQIQTYYFVCYTNGFVLESQLFFSSNTEAHF